MTTKLIHAPFREPERYATFWHEVETALIAVNMALWGSVFAGVVLMEMI